MLSIGLTGGIGSGKSTVTQIFQQFGIPIIDADQIARELVEPNTTTHEIIKKKLGQDYFSADGHLDRQKLREKIFQDDATKVWLENILHPEIRITIQQKMATLQAPYCIVVIPLLIENHLESWFDRILVIDCTEDQQIQRACQRDNSSPEQIRSIIKSQCSRNERVAAADDIIQNNNSFESLQIAIEKLHSQYCDLNQQNS